MSFLKLLGAFVVLAVVVVVACIYFGVAPQGVRDEVAKLEPNRLAAPAPEQPAPEQPAPEQPAPEKSVPEKSAAPEMPAPEPPAPENLTADKLAAEQAAKIERRRAANLVLSTEVKETAHDAARSGLERDVIRDSKLAVVKFLEYPLDSNFPWTDCDVRYSPKTNEIRITSKVKAMNDSGDTVALSWKTRSLMANGMSRLQYLEIDGKVYLSAELPTQSAGAANGAKNAAKDAKTPRRAEDSAKAKEAAAQRRPATAASMLKTAKSFKDAANEDLYQKWLRKVADEYPDTEAGAEALSLIIPENASPLRTWTAAAGNRSIEAELVSLDGDIVTLRRKDGKVFTMPLAKLSQADQDIARSQEGSAKPAP